MIHRTTFVAAPVERVFGLSRSIDPHQYSMQEHSEMPVADTITGLLDRNGIVTRKAKHLFKERILTVKLTQLEKPHFFVDEQVKGDFKSMRHGHYFKPHKNGIIMTDGFYFESNRLMVYSANGWMLVFKTVHGTIADLTK